VEAEVTSGHNVSNQGKRLLVCNKSEIYKGHTKSHEHWEHIFVLYTVEHRMYCQ